MDEFTSCYEHELFGTYDCVDRIVLKAYHIVAHNAGGFRHWWRLLYGTDENLDDTHLMRMAGRFSRRLNAYVKAHDIPIKYCDASERKHELAEEYLAEHPQSTGLFMVVVAKAKAPRWHVKRVGKYVNLYHPKSLAYVNFYHFHINDPDWGHITIRMCGYPPFQAMIMLNGHEYAACQLKKAGSSFVKEGNCFTQLNEKSDLALVADTLRHPDAIGRLNQVCTRWIYSTCLCFALSSEEQEHSRFRYSFFVYQLEFSHNLQFKSGMQMEHLFESVVDRTRPFLNVPRIKTILGRRNRPFHRSKSSNEPLREEIVVETPMYNLTVFKLHFGGLTFKGYTKGEHTLRFEAIAHNARSLRCGCALDKLTGMVALLQLHLERFLNVLQGMDAPFLPDETWETLPNPCQVGACRVGGVDVNKARIRAVMAAVLALAAKPGGFSASDLAKEVCCQTGQTMKEYSPTRAAYDIKKLRGKNLVTKNGNSHRYAPTSDGLRAIAALTVLRDKVLKPLLAGVTHPEIAAQAHGACPTHKQYEAIRKEVYLLLQELHIAA